MSAVWVDPAACASRVGGGVDAASIEVELDAAAAWVEQTVPGDYTDPETVPGNVKLGTYMLAARLFARRGTTLGLQAYEGGVASIVGNDPDLAAMLGLGVHGMPGLR